MIGMLCFKRGNQRDETTDERPTLTDQGFLLIRFLLQSTAGPLEGALRAMQSYGRKSRITPVFAPSLARSRNQPINQSINQSLAGT